MALEPEAGVQVQQFLSFPVSWGTLFTVSGPQVSPLQSRTRTIFTLCACDEQNPGEAVFETTSKLEMALTSCVVGTHRTHSTLSFSTLP